MKFEHFIEVLKMVKEAEKGMPASRFWGLVGCFGGGWLAYAAAKLIEALK